MAEEFCSRFALTVSKKLILTAQYFNMENLRNKSWGLNMWCLTRSSQDQVLSYLTVCVFSYVISTLELMVAEDYMIVYLNGATPHRRMPGLGWLKKCYQMIDRRSVHPADTVSYPIRNKHGHKRF